MTSRSRTPFRSPVEASDTTRRWISTILASVPPEPRIGELLTGEPPLLFLLPFLHLCMMMQDVGGDEEERRHKGGAAPPGSLVSSAPPRLRRSQQHLRTCRHFWRIVERESESCCSSPASRPVCPVKSRAGLAWFSLFLLLSSATARAWLNSTCIRPWFIICAIVRSTSSAFGAHCSQAQYGKSGRGSEVVSVWFATVLTRLAPSFERRTADLGSAPGVVRQQ